MGTFQTARVVPFSAGAFYFGTTQGSSSDAASMAGLVIDGGWPAGKNKFGIGLGGKLYFYQYIDETLVYPIWGGRIQIPENSLADLSLGVDIWGFHPAELRLQVSRVVGQFEPHCCLALANLFYESRDNDLDIFADGSLSFTGGVMFQPGADSNTRLAFEVEAGQLWDVVGFGLALLWQP